MKTTIEIPDALLRKAKVEAAARGQTLRQLVNEALREKLAVARKEGEPEWMKLFGALKGHSAELRRIDAAIEEQFE